MLEFDESYRRRRAEAYSGESIHACARCMSGNWRMTTRRGAQSPSSISVRPPRARKRPPYCATVGGDGFLVETAAHLTDHVFRRLPLRQ